MGKMLSRAVVPRIAVGVARCDTFGDISHGYDDAQLSHCLEKSGIHPTSFGYSFLDNDRKKTNIVPEVVADAEGKHLSLKCYDYVHKLLPEAMLEFHTKFLDAQPCVADASSLLQ